MVDEGVVDASPFPFGNAFWSTFLSLLPIKTDLLKMRGSKKFHLKKIVHMDIMMHISLMTMMMWVWIVRNWLENPYMIPPVREV